MSDRDLLLAGKHIMIVDDEPLLAFDLSDVLTAHGGQIVGPCHSLPEAFDELSRSRGRVDIAVLDVHVGKDIVWPFARRLRDEGVPFFFVSAVCSPDEIDPDFRDVPCLRKPLDYAQLRDTFKKAFA